MAKADMMPITPTPMPAPMPAFAPVLSDEDGLCVGEEDAVADVADVCALELVFDEAIAEEAEVV